MYEGDFINDKFEGNGKLIKENGEYYIGQFKNHLRNGKGIVFYKNGNIMYEGSFVDDKKEGNGKFIFKTGEYYIGNWKHDIINGKGALYYKNGQVMFEGDCGDKLASLSSN